jgi:hypothetical protein
MCGLNSEPTSSGLRLWHLHPLDHLPPHRALKRGSKDPKFTRFLLSSIESLPFSYPRYQMKFTHSPPGSPWPSNQPWPILLLAPHGLPTSLGCFASSCPVVFGFILKLIFVILCIRMSCVHMHLSSHHKKPSDSTKLQL